MPLQCLFLESQTKITSLKYHDQASNSTIIESASLTTNKVALKPQPRQYWSIVDFNKKGKEAERKQTFCRNTALENVSSLVLKFQEICEVFSRAKQAKTLDMALRSENYLLPSLSSVNCKQRKALDRECVCVDKGK